MFYLDVLPFVTVPHPLTYTSDSAVPTGTLVKIRVRNHTTLGIVKGVSEISPGGSFKFSSIEGTVYNAPIVQADNIQIIEWLVRYYGCTLNTAIETALPGLIRQGKTLPKNYCLKATEADVHFSGKSFRQKEVYEWILKHPMASLKAFSEAFPQQTSILKRLIEKGYIAKIENVADEPSYDEVPDEDFTLNEEQQAVFEALKSTWQLDEKRPQVLWGVTGSGKTEIYHKLILEAKKRGQQVIYLVPEIMLSEQALNRLQERLSKHHIRSIAWHCHLSDSEKLKTWHKAIQGKVDVILGTRSALFVPLKNLGLVIVDEEHEPSYKQSENPRYHGRDLAIYRAHITQALCVLGTATPSVETWANVKAQKYDMHRLTSRANGRPLPKVHIADMRYEKPNFEGTYILSSLLREKISERLDDHEQTLLFLNRRGYAPYLYCPKCETRLTCPHCNAHLVFHKNGQCLRCHICDYQMATYSKCTKCGTALKLSRGLGTQRIEACLHQLYKTARILRLDSDVIQSQPHWYEDILAHRYDIIIGTQMLAKGLDFPLITLVGMIQADGLNPMEDFRNAERTFQLIVQVSGRAGRSQKSGEVVLQTFSPNSDCVTFGSKMDVENFLNKEYCFREKYRYPPFRRIIRHIFRSRSEKVLLYSVEQWKRFLLENNIADLEILGPAQPNLNKINSYYRMHVLYLTKNVLATLPKLQTLRQSFKLPSNVIDLLDVDPIDFR